MWPFSKIASLQRRLKMSFDEIEALENRVQQSSCRLAEKARELAIAKRDYDDLMEWAKRIKFENDSLNVQALGLRGEIDRLQKMSLVLGPVRGPSGRFVRRPK